MKTSPGSQFAKCKARESSKGRDSGDNLQKSRITCTVSADQAEAVALGEVFNADDGVRHLKAVSSDE